MRWKPSIAQIWRMGVLSIHQGSPPLMPPPSSSSQTSATTWTTAVETLVRSTGSHPASRNRKWRRFSITSWSKTNWTKVRRPAFIPPVFCIGCLNPSALHAKACLELASDICLLSLRFSDFFGFKISSVEKLISPTITLENWFYNNMWVFPNGFEINLNLIVGEGLLWTESFIHKADVQPSQYLTF